MSNFILAAPDVSLEFPYLFLVKLVYILTTLDKNKVEWLGEVNLKQKLTCKIKLLDLVASLFVSVKYILREKEVAI